jgi:hypothetical protein
MIDKFNCPNCGPSEARIMAQVVVSMPYEMRHNDVSKSAIRLSDVRLYGTMWNSASILCLNCKVTFEHGNPVGGAEHMRAQRARLLEQLAALESVLAESAAE